MPSGSNITLTCTVEMSPAVDIPVTVNTVIFTPNRRVLTNSTQQVMTYADTVMIRSQTLTGTEQSDSGVYKCIAFVSSASPFLTDSNSTTNLTKISMHTYLRIV